MIDISIWYIIAFVQLGWILIGIMHIFDIWNNEFYSELIKDNLTKQKKDKLIKHYGYKNLILDIVYLAPLLFAMFIIKLITPNKGS